MLKIACDWFLPLRMYSIPNDVVGDLTTQFPFIDIVPANIKDGQPFVKDADVYWGNRITPEIVKKTNKLKWIHFGSVGTNRLKKTDLHERDILVTNSPGMVSDAMTDSVICHITTLARGYHRIAKLRSANQLTREGFDIFFDDVTELNGANCLIVGFGEVGRRVAKVCSALGMKVSVVTRDGQFPQGLECGLDNIHEVKNLSFAVENMDFIVNLLPLNSSTLNVFSESVLEKCPKDSFFVNVGRGETVDETALIRLIKDGHFKGVALDVFQKEPLSYNSALYTSDNVVITPHIAGISTKYWERQREFLIDSLTCFLAGKIDKIQNQVNLG